MVGKKILFFLFITLLVFCCILAATFPKHKSYTATVKLTLPSESCEGKEKIAAATPEIPRSLQSIATGELIWDQTRQQGRIVFTCTSNSARTSIETVSNLATNYRKKISPEIDNAMAEDALSHASENLATAQAATREAKAKLDAFLQKIQQPAPSQQPEVTPVSYKATISPLFQFAAHGSHEEKKTPGREQTSSNESANLPKVEVLPRLVPNPRREELRQEINSLVQQRGRMLLKLTNAHPAIEIISNDIAQLTEEFDNVPKMIPANEETFVATTIDNHTIAPGTVERNPWQTTPAEAPGTVIPPSADASDAAMSAQERELTRQYEQALQQQAIAAGQLASLWEDRYRNVAGQVSISEPVVLQSRSILMPWTVTTLGMAGAIAILCGWLAIRIAPGTPLPGTEPTGFCSTDPAPTLHEATSSTPSNRQVGVDESMLDHLDQARQTLEIPILGRIPDKGVCLTK